MNCPFCNEPEPMHVMTCAVMAVPNFARRSAIDKKRAEIEAMNTEALTKLVTRWRKDADQYKRQAEECLTNNLPCEQMISGSTFLRLCAKELESALAEVKP